MDQQPVKQGKVQNYQPVSKPRNAPPPTFATGYTHVPAYPPNMSPMMQPSYPYIPIQLAQYAGGQQAIMPQFVPTNMIPHHSYPMNTYPGSYIQQLPMPMYQQAPPPVKREKKILGIVDPSTQKNVNLTESEEKENIAVPLEDNVENAPLSPTEELPDVGNDTKDFNESFQNLDESNLVNDCEDEANLDKDGEKQADLIKFYEDKIVDFNKDPKDNTDLSNMVYGRKMCELLRDIIKNLKTVACPLSEDVLKKLGIDRESMPQVTNFASRKSKVFGRDNPNSFNQQSQGNNNASRRHFGNERIMNKPKPFQQPRNFPMPKEIKRKKPTILVRSANAWTPEIAKPRQPQVQQESLEARTAKLRKEIRGLLNKITPSTYQELATQMINKALWKDEETLPVVVELIFMKAVEEPTFVGIYADLCSALHESERRREGTDFKRNFYNAIIRRCQDSFETNAVDSSQKAIKEVQTRLEEETDSKKREELKELLEEKKFKEKRHTLGTVRFISHLYRIKVLGYKVIDHCICLLLRNFKKYKEELMVEYCIRLIETSSASGEDLEELSTYVNYVQAFKSEVSNRIRFMIADLDDLRKKNFAVKNDGPKTKEEIKYDHKKEEEQNKIDREKYISDSKKKKSQPANKPLPPSRNSVAKKERMMKAGAAASAAATTTTRKDVSLSKVDIKTTLSTSKWKQGSGNPSFAAVLGANKSEQ